MSVVPPPPDASLDDQLQTSATAPTANTTSGLPNEASQANSGRVFARGMAWQAGMRWSAQVISWSSTIFIARALSPSDYGVVGLVTWFALLLSIITDFGIGTTVLTKRDLTPHVIAQLNAVACWLGVGAFLVTALGAPLLVAFYGEPRIGPVLLVLACGFLCTALAVVPIAIMQRELRYRALAVLDFAKAITTTGTVVVLATMKYGYWALVIGNLAGTVVFAVASYSLSPQRFARPQWTLVRSPFVHGSYLLLGSLAYAIYANSDFVVVGKVLGVTAAGYYSLAWTLATLPSEKITNVVQSVIRPFFAAVQSDANALRRYFLVTTQLLAALLTPMFLGLALVARDAIPILLGAKWLPAVPALQCLCFYAIGQNLHVMCTHVLVARGETRRISLYSVMWAAFLPPLFWWAASQFGFMGIPIIWLLVQPIIMVYPLQRTLRQLEMSFFGYAIALKPVVVAAAAMCAAVAFVQYMMVGDLSFLRLVVAVGTGAAMYAGVWYLFYREEAQNLIGMLRASSPGKSTGS
jgi:teichuronic acid exporter